MIDITYFINDADVEKYTKLVSNNYNLTALEALSDYMDVQTDFSECGFGVNLHKTAGCVLCGLLSVGCDSYSKEYGEWPFRGLVGMEWNEANQHSVRSAGQQADI